MRLRITSLFSLITKILIKERVENNLPPYQVVVNSEKIYTQEK